MRPGRLDGGGEDISPSDFVTSKSRPWLHGFWNESNAQEPSECVLVYGDREKFNEDREAARARAKRRLDQLATNRWIIIEEWPDSLFSLESGK